MPKNPDIKKVLVIGSGPIVIGQAAEFDYAGTQACRSLKEEGVSVVLVNSNPATIMTDKRIADHVYIEPLTAEVLEQIIEKERPDSVLPTLGGQAGLNLGMELAEKGILEKYGCRLIGTTPETIRKAEDRQEFKDTMEKIGEPCAASKVVHNIPDGLEFAEQIGYPVVLRPAYTMGGAGGGLVYNKEELKTVCARGLQASLVGQVLVEESILGWEELELEVVRDEEGNMITVCFIENIDPLGVHTGDSFCAAPMLTISKELQARLQEQAYRIVDSVRVIGGTNVQFAHDPVSDRIVVIEINPRTSRSSALASKATGYPIAKVAAKIALGYNLDEIKNAVTGKTFACFEPTLDYVVLKFPRWPFDKFFGAKRTLGTKMMATGEIMSIGKSFEAALLKGIRSLEIGQYGLERKSSKARTLEELKRRVVVPDDERLFDLAEMLRRGYKEEKVCQITGMDLFFVDKINKIVKMEEELKNIKVDEFTEESLSYYKEKGFSDKAISNFVGCKPPEIYALRKKWNIMPVFKMVDTCAGEFEAVTPYYYSSYDTETEVRVSDKKKVMVIGSGPIRIGQGIEFDYCSVHCIKALKKAGIETIIVNNNPETVSTDFDTADKLYFEPLTEEDVLNVVETEKPDGVILQFGGQTAIKLANFFDEMHIPILGTLPEQIDAAEDREKFDEILESLDIRRPKGKGVWTLEEGIAVANELTFPVLVRPSYVLGGQGMEITHNEEQLTKYLVEAFEKDKKNPVLIDRYLGGREIEVDAICDGTDVYIPGIMEHLERAGVHSGDSISIYPPQHISEDIQAQILDETKRISNALKIIGMINIQFIEFRGELNIIEVNPRSSRTVPYITKVTGVPVIDIATNVMLGSKLADMGYSTGIAPTPDVVAVKVPVFSTEKLPQVEVSLGPEMRSTGEVLGVGYNLENALYKGFIASGMTVPKAGSTILATVRSQDHETFVPIAKRCADLGCNFIATKGTAKVLQENGIDCKVVKKISEGVPNIIDTIRSGVIDLIVDIPKKANDVKSDGFKIRRTAIESDLTLITALDTFKAMVDVMEKKINQDELAIFDINRDMRK